ncbi:hypothetical protein [Glutamicibacter sp. V16R2B1]|uniref:hypothetical protein n=1 Tax=Glutamicibacter sp. V16R2B1 TaxID=2036207 RepID=UPI0010FDF8E9|nr:hypothetical protein [Glutamicibacter sp. V16R2B1]MCK9901275.1 hypothetical protein [Frankia sp. Cpl3]TLK47187.1 hypothetical protein FDN03_15930 [Glutamicibacter sp. V16R2B1]
MPALIRRRNQPEPWSGRVHTPHHRQTLTASAQRLDLSRRDAATPLIIGVRRPWQAQAWDYYGQVGELRYANKFRGNAARKTVFVPAVYMDGEPKPVPIEDSDQAGYADAAHEALSRLGGSDARSILARDTMENLGIAGECYLVGRQETGEAGSGEVWEVRSISEMGVKDGRPFILQYPGDRNGISLGPGDFAARLWTYDPQFRMLADSAVRVAIETCLEELVVLGKDIRASATSRVALNGILAIPDSMQVISRTDAGTGSLEDDPFMADLIAGGTEAIRDPGSAAAALPFLLSGSAQDIAAIKHITLARPESESAQKRAEALGRLASTLDLPPEIMSGLGSASNHWTAWMITDSMWRDHLEPGVQDIAEAWTRAFYRPYLAEAGVPDDVLSRMVIWYDPTGVIVKPDRSQAAADAYERLELSGAAYRDHIGFRDEEAPDEEETLRRAALKGLFDQPTTLAILTGQPIPEPAPAVEPAPPSDDEVVDAEPIDEGDGPPNGGTPPDEPADDLPDAAAMRRRVLDAQGRRLAIATPTPLVAAGQITADEALALSQRLAATDTQLRERVRGAAEASVKRALERAGSRIVSKGKRDATVAAAVADIPTWAVPARLGPVLVAAIDDVDEASLLATVLAELQTLWGRYVTAASDFALRQAARLVGMDVNEAFAVLDGRFRADRAAGWLFLSERLTDVTRAALLMDPSEAIAAGRLVSPSVARAAIAVAGGFNGPTSQGINTETLLPVDRSEHFGGIGTGTTIKEFAESRGADVERYQWIHGFSERAFEPHLALDRRFFDSWDDDTLRAPEGADFMGSHMRPGDHKGCSCDMVLVWTPPAQQGDTQ